LEFAVRGDRDKSYILGGPYNQSKSSESRTTDHYYLLRLAK